MIYYFPYHLFYPHSIYRQKTWPIKVFAPYVDMTLPPFLKFGEVGPKLGLNYYHLGFIVATSGSDYTPSWGGYEPLDSPAIAEQIKKVRTNGGDVAISFGGSNNLPIYKVAPDAITTASVYMEVIKEYQVTRIDFDIEGDWLEDREGLDKNFSAIKIIQEQSINSGRRLDTWLTIPVLPTGITSYGLKCLTLALEKNVLISGINLMAMDYGDANAPEPEGKMGTYAISACNHAAEQLARLFAKFRIPKSKNQIYNMLGITSMIGINDVPSEIFTTTDAKELVTYGHNKNLGQLSIWSLNRDHPCPKDVTNYTKCSGVAQQPYEFTKIYNNYQ